LTLSTISAKIPPIPKLGESYSLITSTTSAKLRGPGFLEFKVCLIDPGKLAAGL
jgi:hypothetical protein